jgi:chemotaxis protein MotB
VPQPVLRNVLKVLASQAGKLPNPISIEGHTDSTPFSDSTTYGNWELSSDRANAARRLMENSGLQPGQVVQVRGFADRKPRKPDNPTDPSNRRISILIQFVSDMQKEATTSGNDLRRVEKPTTSQ